MDHTKGYLDDGNWWHNPAHPKAFTYCDLNDYYPEDYIDAAEMPTHVVEAYVKYVMEFYTKITGKQLNSVIEFGSAGGWFLKAFLYKGLVCLGLEGSDSGIKKCRDKGILERFIAKVDLRNPIQLLNQYDIALSSEVLEHTEPPFAGTHVRSIVQSSNLVWFSSEPPNTNRPHLHHCNEQPLEYWKALFGFFNYGCYMLPDYVHEQTAERGRCIFYNKDVYDEIT